MLDYRKQFTKRERFGMNKIKAVLTFAWIIDDSDNKTDADNYLQRRKKFALFGNTDVIICEVD